MTKKAKMDAATMSREEIGNHVGEFTRAKIHADKLTAQMNIELDRVRAKHAEQIEAAQKTAALHAQVIEAWAEGNKDLFDNTRTMEFARGFVGFRLGNFKIVTPKGITQQDAAEMLAKLPWGSRFIRQTIELDKQALIAARDELTAAQTAKAGIAIVQEEKFFLEAKQDEPQPVEA